MCLRGNQLTGGQLTKTGSADQNSRQGPCMSSSTACRTPSFDNSLACDEEQATQRQPGNAVKVPRSHFKGWGRYSRLDLVELSRTHNRELLLGTFDPPTERETSASCTTVVKRNFAILKVYGLQHHHSFPRY